MFDLVDNGSWSRDVMGLICHTPHLCTIFLTNILLLCPCDGIPFFLFILYMGSTEYQRDDVSCLLRRAVTRICLANFLNQSGFRKLSASQSQVAGN